jgi:AraC-like DNA-binding protein
VIGEHAPHLGQGSGGIGKEHERVLAQHEVEVTEDPPMQYLTRWRMQLAARLLAEGTSKVASVAREVGYDSEAAFSRAFKKTAGMSPAAWRRQHAARTSGPAPSRSTPIRTGGGRQPRRRR